MNADEIDRLLADNKHVPYLTVIKRNRHRDELWAEARDALLRAGYTEHVADALWERI